MENNIFSPQILNMVLPGCSISQKDSKPGDGSAINLMQLEHIVNDIKKKQTKDIYE